MALSPLLQAACPSGFLAFICSLSMRSCGPGLVLNLVASFQDQDGHFLIALWDKQALLRGGADLLILVLLS